MDYTNARGASQQTCRAKPNTHCGNPLWRMGKGGTMPLVPLPLPCSITLSPFVFCVVVLVVVVRRPSGPFSVFVLLNTVSFTWALALQGIAAFLLCLGNNVMTCRRGHTQSSILSSYRVQHNVDVTCSFEILRYAPYLYSQLLADHGHLQQSSRWRGHCQHPGNASQQTLHNQVIVSD